MAENTRENKFRDFLCKLTKRYIEVNIEDGIAQDDPSLQIDSLEILKKLWLTAMAKNGYENRQNVSEIYETFEDILWGNFGLTAPGLRDKIMEYVQPAINHHIDVDRLPLQRDELRSLADRIYEYVTVDSFQELLKVLEERAQEGDHITLDGKSLFENLWLQSMSNNGYIDGRIEMAIDPDDCFSQPACKELIDFALIHPDFMRAESNDKVGFYRIAEELAFNFYDSGPYFDTLEWSVMADFCDSLFQKYNIYMSPNLPELIMDHVRSISEHYKEQGMQPLVNRHIDVDTLIKQSPELKDIAHILYAENEPELKNKVIINGIEFDERMIDAVYEYRVNQLRKSEVLEALMSAISHFQDDGDYELANAIEEKAYDIADIIVHDWDKIRAEAYEQSVLAHWGYDTFVDRVANQAHEYIENNIETSLSCSEDMNDPSL